MKDIVISGITYTGVQQIYFNKKGGGKAVYIDADTRTDNIPTCNLTFDGGKMIQLKALLGEIDTGDCKLDMSTGGNTFIFNALPQTATIDTFIEEIELEE